MKSLRYHPAVQRDLDEAMEFYLSVSDRVAEEFWIEVTAAIERVHAYPDSGHQGPNGLLRFNLRKFPYHILYVETSDRVRVQVVRHHSRRPSFGIGRQKS